MRVISGEFGGRKLLTAEGFTTRPTTDKVRQAIFNSLASSGALDDAIVIDLFAGSGALGIEALSRGAARCTFVERDRSALAALRDNIAGLRLGDRATVVATDVLGWLRSASPADIAFSDPPYEFADWHSLQVALPVPLLVAESGGEVAPAEGWQALRSRRYGRTWVTTLQRVT
jgi:16S rRNA (guanine966-N2)-methyltransferase